MLLFVTIFHIFVSVLLVIFVLIQDSKGGGAFGMGGSGGSNQLFSSTGAANFLVKTTRVLAILFAVTCISLTWLTLNKGGSVTDQYIPAAAPAPAAGQEAAVPGAPASTGAPESTNAPAPTGAPTKSESK